ncbi:MAG: hypothetical protein V4651_02095 [Bacteroidota bacterium]
MNELFNSYKQFIKDRFSTPFFANFIFAWCVCNWKALYLTIFIDQTAIAPKTKIDFITDLYQNEDISLLWKPLFTAIAFTLFFPLLNVLVFLYRELLRKFRRKLGMNINKNTSILATEYWELDSQLKIVEGRYNESINKYRELQNTNRALNDEKEALNNRLVKKEGDLESTQKALDQMQFSLDSINEKYSLSTFDNKKYKMRLITNHTGSSHQEIDDAILSINNGIVAINDVIKGKVDFAKVDNANIIFRVAKPHGIERIPVEDFLLFDLTFYNSTKMFNGYMFDSDNRQLRSCVLELISY